LSQLVDDLRSEVAKGHVLAIVGAGVSTAVAGGAAVASWTGLLKSGIERCVEVAHPLPNRWAERVREELESGDLDDRLSAAEKVSAKLGAPTGGEYRRWLRETVGQLKIQDRSVIEALRELGIPLATTNYDGLLEEVTGRPPVTWREEAKVERVLRGDEPGVLHLHGYWDEPESVVLGLRSYEQVLGDAHAQTIEQALRATRSLLFVGCGEGLADPNFGALLRWSRSVFSGSEYRHFRLCLNSEVASVQAQHPSGERIFACGYGDNHEALAPFLRNLKAPDQSQTGNDLGAPGQSLTGSDPGAAWTGFAVATCLIVLVAFWFERHIYPYAKLLLTTSCAALAAAVAFAARFLKLTSADKTAKSFLPLLNKPLYQNILKSGILLAIVLLLTTSSIHVTLHEINPEGSFELRIKQQERTLVERVILSRKSPYFFHLLWLTRPGPIKLELLKPAGYAPAQEQLSLGGIIRFEVPIDFKRKDLHVLRLVPGWGIIEALPEAGDTAASRTVPNCSVAGCDCEEVRDTTGSIYRFLRVRFPNRKTYCTRWYLETIYIGAGAAELEGAVTDRSDTNWLKVLEDQNAPLTKEESGYLERAASHALYFPTTDLAFGDKVEIELVLTDGRSSEIHHLDTYTVPSSSLPQTRLLKDLS
jgi:SIR2-like protein